MKLRLTATALLMLLHAGCIAPRGYDATPTLRSTRIGEWQFEFKVPADEAHVVRFPPISSPYADFGPSNTKVVTEPIWGYDGGLFKGIYGGVSFDCALVQVEPADGDMTNPRNLRQRLVRQWKPGVEAVHSNRDAKGSTWLCANLSAADQSSSTRAVICLFPLTDRVYLIAYLRMMDHQNPKATTSWLDRAERLYNMINDTMAICKVAGAQ
jgi:hypothetical protein